MKFTIGTLRHRKAGDFKKIKDGNWKKVTEDKNKKMMNASEESSYQLKAIGWFKIINSLTSGANIHEAAQIKTMLKDFINSVDEGGHHDYDKSRVESILKRARAFYQKNKPRKVEKAKKLPVGTIRKWRSGKHIKDKLGHWKKLKESFKELKTSTDKDLWVAQQFASNKKNVAHLLFTARGLLGQGTPLSTVPDKGVKGLCKALIEKLYEHGPNGLDKDQIEVFSNAFADLFKKALSVNKKVIPLEKALAYAESKPFFKKNPEWFNYCCTRQAEKNDGAVDLTSIEKYMKSAMKYHGTKSPPPIDHDDSSGTIRAQANLGLIHPEKAVKKIKNGTVAGPKTNKKLKRGRKK